MANGASNCLSLFLLSLLIVCSSGTLVGFFYDARKSNAISSVTEIISFLKLNKLPNSQIRVFVADHRVLGTFSNTSLPVYLYLNKTQVDNLRNYKPCAISWLKTSLLTFLPHVKIKNIIVSSNSNELAGENELPMLLSTLKSVHSILGSFRLDREVGLSVKLSLSFLENFNRKYERDLLRIFDFIDKIRSFVIIEANIYCDLRMGYHQFVESVIKRATLAASVLPYSDVLIVLTIKSSVVPIAKEVAEFEGKILRSLENRTRITGKIIGLFVEVFPINDNDKKEVEMEEEQMFQSSHRELLNNFHYKTTQHDSIDPPTTIFPTTPITNPATTPVTVPTGNPAPIIVTVPSTNPVTVSPNPSSTPVTVPSSTPVSVPNTNPATSPVPITNPVTTPPPVTNPVTTYPTPPGGVPVTTPVTNPVAPPATTNSPIVPGQSWCVAKSGVLETALQSALDYACGIGGADCSSIQQSGSCYNPNSLQNHASYAFNSYYQKNPVQTSCDFGGTAMVTNINPSTGSCIYPSSSSSSSSTPMTAPPTPMTAPPTPTTASPMPTTASPTPTTASPTPTPTTTSTGAAVPGSGSPPTVLNTSNPASGTTTVFGDSPPIINNSTAMSTGLQPFIGCIILVTSITTGKFILDM